MQIDGCSALVTGSASGIGAAVARQLAAGGARVVVADLQADKGRELAEEIGGVFCEVDVTDTAQIEAAVVRATEIGELRVLVNSAGIGWAQRTIGRDGEFDSAHDINAFKKVMAINLIGSFDAIRLAASAMSKLDPTESGDRGAIVTIASVAAGSIVSARLAWEGSGLLSLVPLLLALPLAGWVLVTARGRRWSTGLDAALLCTAVAVLGVVELLTRVLD